MLGTFYPLDIKGDMRGVLLQIEKSMLRHTHLKFHFRRTTFSKGEKKAIANKNDYRTGGFTKLEQRTDCDPAQTVNKSGSAIGPFPPALPCKPAQPRDGPKQSLPDPQLPSPPARPAMPKYGACPQKRPLSLSPVLPPQPHTTLGLRPHGKHQK